MEPGTHLGIDARFSGDLVALDKGSAHVRLQTTDAMRADARGLVHGGFVFSAADYAAMLAVNDPHVVLGSADLRFTAPVEVGEAVDLHARVNEVKGRKHVVSVHGDVGERRVIEGTLVTFVLDAHVLDGRG